MPWPLTRVVAFCPPITYTCRPDPSTMMVPQKNHQKICKSYHDVSTKSHLPAHRRFPKNAKKNPNRVRKDCRIDGGIDYSPCEWWSPSDGNRDTHSIESGGICRVRKVSMSICTLVTSFHVPGKSGFSADICLQRHIALRYPRKKKCKCNVEGVILSVYARRWCKLNSPCRSRIRLLTFT